MYGSYEEYSILRSSINSTQDFQAVSFQQSELVFLSIFV